jgi:RND family efflux transporter MFP subunit
MRSKSIQLAGQRLIWQVLSCLTLLVLGGCGKADPQAGQPTKGPSALPVHVTTVQRISMERQVDLSGTLISPDQARVSSEVAGVVTQVLAELGQEVKPGQVLVRLEPRELELALERAQSLLRQTEAQLGIDGVRVKDPLPDEQVSMVRTAKANLDDARAQLARAQRLMKQRLLPQADMDTAETRVKVTEAAYQTAMETVQSLKASLQERRVAVELAQKKLNDAVIKSPVAGSVSERLVHPGEFIQQNVPVIGLVQMNPLKLKTAVQERHASVIQPNQAVQFSVETFPNEVFSGRVAFVSPAVDQATRTFTVEVLVDNSHRRLKPGFFAKGAIYLRRDTNVPALPEEAVSTLAGVSTVFVVENNRVQQKVVTLGARNGKSFELLDGLKGDEVLATSNLNQLANGTPVHVLTDDGKPPAQREADHNPTAGEKGGRRL